METIEDYIVNELFKQEFLVEEYSSNGVIFGSDKITLSSGNVGLIIIHFDNPISKKLLKPIQNYTKSMFEVKHEGFQDYNIYESPTMTDLTCYYDNFEDPSVLICLSDRIRNFINKRTSEFEGYQVEDSAVLLNNDDFMDVLEGILEDVLYEIENLSEEYVFSFKHSICDEFSNYIWKRLNNN